MKKENGKIKKAAVVLLSGGLDSATAMAIAISEGFGVYSISFDYGQRHRLELSAAKKVADKIGAKKHIIFQIDLRTFGGSALTDEIEIPKNRSLDSPGIPITYVPARNTIFLSIALGWAEVIGAENIFIGVNSIDYSGYPDCRPEFIEEFEKLANIATKTGVEGLTHIKIRAPLINMTKAEIIRRGTELGVDYSITISCYDPDSEGRACGRCDSCLLRLKGFAENGITDPALYTEKN